MKRIVLGIVCLLPIAAVLATLTLAAVPQTISSEILISFHALELILILKSYEYRSVNSSD